MQEVLITINGNREIPLFLNEDIIGKLYDSNSEFIFLATVSPEKTETILSHDEEPPKLHFKLKICGGCDLKG